MTEARDYEICLTASDNLRSLVALMQQDGIDVIVASGETKSGLPFTVTLTQGAFAQHAQVDGNAFRHAVAQMREL